MKVILFRSGRAGVMASLPGEHSTEEELETLLGGETDMISIDDHLILITLRAAERLRLPLRYWVNRAGKLAEPIAGDCAVVALDGIGRYIDVITMDYVRAIEAVMPVKRDLS